MRSRKGSCIANLSTAFAVQTGLVEHDLHLIAFGNVVYRFVIGDHRQHTGEGLRFGVARKHRARQVEVSPHATT